MHRSLNLRGLVAPLLCLMLSSGCGSGDRAFETPEQAVQALIATIQDDDDDGLVAILGEEYRDQIISSDWEAERETRRELVTAFDDELKIRTLPGGEVEVLLGADEWPMPILLEQDENGVWRFDTEEGIQEVIDRRIGRHELAAVAIANAYVDAQIEYARVDRNGDGVKEYAQRLASSPGQRDGLYWETEPGEPLSPFGPLVASAERYFDEKEAGDPIQGYFFKILTKQGQNSPGGTYDYVVDGKMIAGFALVAFPEKYQETGIMTFVVSHHGKVKQKDLGAFTGMDTYDPDETWALAD